MTYDTYGRLRPKPTLNYKSQLESKVSDWLTSNKIPFIYEVNTFKTTIGNYTPDFYIPGIKTYIEVKPNVKEFVNENYHKLLRAFSYEYKVDLLVIPSEGDILYFEYYPENEYCKKDVWEDTEGYLAKCVKCKSMFFTSNIGNYYCRACNYHNGDHDLIESINDNWKRFYEKFGVFKK